MINFNTTHARHDPAHCLAPGLFRSLKKGDRKKDKLDVMYKYGQNESIHFAGFEPLGAEDLRLLQGIVALSGPNGLILDPVSEKTTSKQLLLFLDPKFEALRMDVLVIKESMNQLLREVGLTTGGYNKTLLKSSLKRMANVTVFIQKGGREMSCHLMSYAFNADDGSLYISLNPRITEAVLGNRPHTYIDMKEVRGLKTNPGRLVHQRLCAFIDPGKRHKISIETLCAYIWHTPTEVVRAIRERRTTAKKALKEIEKVGWDISEYKPWFFDISRPQRADRVLTTS